MLAANVANLLLLHGLLLLHPASGKMPRLTGALRNVTVPEGKSAEFTCSVAHLGGFKVAWIKSDTKAILAIHDHVLLHSDTGKITVTHNDRNTWTLRIRVVDERDAGWYQCQINSEPILQQEAYLDVVVPPKIDDHLSTGDVSVAEGKSVELRCYATGTPKPEISWRKMGQPKGDDPLSRGNSYVIQEVSRAHMGSYMCVAHNGIPPARSKIISLSVNFKPELRVGNQLVGAPVLTTVVLNCTVEAYPLPIIFWKDPKGRVILNGIQSSNVSEAGSGPYTKTSTLSKRLVSTRDFGSYKCCAKNTIGTTEEGIKLVEIPTPRRGGTSAPRRRTTPAPPAWRPTRPTSRAGGGDRDNGRRKNKYSPMQTSGGSSPATAAALHKVIIGVVAVVFITLPERKIHW